MGFTGGLTDVGPRLMTENPWESMLAGTWLPGNERDTQLMKMPNCKSHVIWRGGIFEGESGRSATAYASSTVSLTLLEGVEAGLAGLGRLHTRAQEVQADVN